MSTGLSFALICAVVAILYGVISIYKVLKLPEGNDAMRSISLAVREGASAYLKRQYITIGVVGVILFVVILFAINVLTAVGFIVGAVLSGLTGFIGMHVSVRSNSRTAEAARLGLNPALRSRVLGYWCPTLVDAVGLVAQYEDDQKQFLEERPMGKGKMFPPRPSPSREKPPNMAPQRAMLASMLIAPAMVAATVPIRMSRCFT